MVMSDMNDHDLGVALFQSQKHQGGVSGALYVDRGLKNYSISILTETIVLRQEVS